MDDLLQRVLALSFDRLEAGGPMLPFALVVRSDQTIECLTIVTDRSDKAAYLGRRLVRENAATAIGYAIATDGYVRCNDERLDAVIVELGTRGDAAAQVTAQPYRGLGGTVSPVGEIIALGQRPSELEAWDPHVLDWGGITPDIYVEAQRLAVHIVNHNFELEENVERTLRFLRARIRQHAPHLPAGSSQLVHYDDRGQSISSNTRSMLVGGVGENIPVRFASAGNG